MSLFVSFGRAGLDVTEIFGWYEDPEAERVKVHAKHAGTMDLIGPEFAKFMRFVNIRAIDSDSAPVLFGASTDVSGDAPGAKVKRSSR